MQDYFDFAEKNGVKLLNLGTCQFCGAKTSRGIHECLEVFNVGFKDLNFNNVENHNYRFFIVDAHALQHPEIHGRWSNHFHLTRLHLVFQYEVNWSYNLSPRLSDFLNIYKKDRQDEYLRPPKVLERGTITSSDIIERRNDARSCTQYIRKWAFEVYHKWESHHKTVDEIAEGFLN